MPLIRQLEHSYTTEFFKCLIDMHHSGAYCFKGNVKRTIYIQSQTILHTAPSYIIEHTGTGIAAG